MDHNERIDAEHQCPLNYHLLVDDLRMDQKLLQAVHRELKEKYNIDHVTILLEETDMQNTFRHTILIRL